MTKKETLQNTVKDFAPGLPRKSKITELPEKKDKIWEFVIQKHHADRAGLHYDVRLGDPETGVGHSFVIKKTPPKFGERVLARHTSDHRISYFDFKGKIDKGYGKGMVKRHMRGKAYVHQSSPDKLSFSLDDKSKHTLVRMKDKNWLLIKSKLKKEAEEKLDISPDSIKDISLKAEKMGYKFRHNSKLGDLIHGSVEYQPKNKKFYKNIYIDKKSPHLNAVKLHELSHILAMERDGDLSEKSANKIALEILDKKNGSIYKNIIKKQAEDLKTAKTLADDLIKKHLRRHAYKISVVGSIARKHDQVNDIDVVMWPKKSFNEYSDFIGQSGKKVMKFDYEGMPVNLFIADKKSFEPTRYHFSRGKGIIQDKLKAKEKGYKLTRYGLQDGNKIHTKEKKIKAILQKN